MLPAMFPGFISFLPFSSMVILLYCQTLGRDPSERVGAVASRIPVMHDPGFPRLVPHISRVCFGNGAGFAGLGVPIVVAARFLQN